MTTKELDKEIKTVQDYIKEEVYDDPVSQQERLRKLSQYMGWIPELKSQVQKALEEATGKATLKLVKGNYQWTILNNLIKAEVSEENARFVQVERIGATIGKQIDALRTLISYAKEERKES